MAELPDFCLDVPVVGWEVEVGVEASEDNATVVMVECLWNQEGTLTVQIISSSPLIVQIINPTTGRPLYRNLLEEGFISEHLI